MKTLLLTLCALPFSANATLLHVSYEGTVASSDNPEYAIGDRFAESYIIDTALAPPDVFPEDPNTANYIGLPCGCANNFIIGSRDDAALPGYDSAAVFRFLQGQYPGTYSLYQITNAYAIGTPERSWLTIDVGLPNLVSNDDLVQSFEVASPEGTSRVVGVLRTGLAAVRTTVTFTTKLFSVTPTPGIFACRR